MPDKTLQCKDCNEQFVFTEGEQAFYKEKGFEKSQEAAETRRRWRRPGFQQQVVKRQGG
jgi:N-acetylglutamate synthase-like GNAT family acetyltransferase